MEKIEFKVSAKTARLIGRENISDVDGAVIELVKNSYDADADCVYIKFDMPFPYLLKQTTLSFLKEQLNDDELDKVLKFYVKEGDKLIRKKELTEDEEQYLKNILYSKNKIVLIDNGTGMTSNTIKTTWMNIGTNDKEINTYSKKGRVKTGAKGIGRFALEKLSLKTQVFTKNMDDNFLEWKIDWQQFDNVEMLDEIKATLEEKRSTFEKTVRIIIGEKEFERVKNYNWSSGTIIVLNPIREDWSERLFKKINNNMQSINPLGSVDKFDIIINNQYYKEYSFETLDLEIQEYDYRIKAEYDGGDTIKVLLKRNEIDLNAKKAIVKDKNETYEFELDEFWEREAFQKKDYKKEDYDKEIERKIKVEKILSDEEQEKVKQVGKFSILVYFLKGANSEYSIIKKIALGKRKELLKKFSGIKLYRDNFKVRPYGEEEMFDWLNLGARAQKSPAGITHESGNWRVLPYQTIGWVNIGRVENKNLSDMANREGLVLNAQYYIFIKMIQKILSEFEYDRQYIYREYGKWLKPKLKERDKTDKIVKDVTAVKKRKEEYKEEKDEYTKEDYRETVYELEDKRKEEEKARMILMSFSSAGIITNTFAHEISRISSDMRR